jgi:hypothetical protein
MDVATRRKSGTVFDRCCFVVAGSSFNATSEEIFAQRKAAQRKELPLRACELAFAGCTVAVLHEGQESLGAQLGCAFITIRI